MGRPTIVKRLLKRIQHKAGMCCPADSPTNDIAGIDVDHERDIDEPAQGRDVGKIRDTQLVGRWCTELAVNVIQRTGRSFIADGGAHGLATDLPCQAE